MKEKVERLVLKDGRVIEAVIKKEIPPFAVYKLKHLDYKALTIEKHFSKYFYPRYHGKTIESAVKKAIKSFKQAIITKEKDIKINKKYLNIYKKICKELKEKKYKVVDNTK